MKIIASVGLAFGLIAVTSGHADMVDVIAFALNGAFLTKELT